jgi:hypothetical protein
MNGHTSGDAQTVDEDLAETLERQIIAVDRRVRLGGDVYAEETEEIRVAARHAQALRTELGLGRLVGSLTPATGKPQVLLAFASEVHGPVVLKVYGTTRQGEAASQRFWVANGVRSVPILDSGDTPVSWLLMERIPDAPLWPDDADLQTRRRSLTRELAAIMMEAHACGEPDPASTHGLVRSWLRHLTIIVNVLHRHGYDVPPRWADVVRSAGVQGRRVLLHADLTVSNLIRDRRDGRLRIFDASGTIGPAAFDAARWCARTGGASAAEELLDDWLAVAHYIDRAQSRALLGVELLMQAGVNELVKAEKGESVDTPDAVTTGCLERSAELLDEFDA